MLHILNSVGVLILETNWCVAPKGVKMNISGLAIIKRNWLQVFDHGPLLRDVGVLTGEEFRRAIGNTSLDLELILFLFTETGDDVLSVRSSLGIIPVILANKSVVKVIDDVLLLKVLNCAPSDFDLLMVNSFSVDVAWLKTLSVHFNKFGQPFSFNYIIVAKSVEIDLFNGVVEVGVDCLHKDVVRRARIQIGYFNFLQRGSGEFLSDSTHSIDELTAHLHILVHSGGVVAEFDVHVVDVALSLCHGGQVRLRVPVHGVGHLHALVAVLVSGDHVEHVLSRWL